MNPEHRKKLQDKNIIDKLLQHINFEELAPRLIAQKVFTPAMIDDIQGQSSEPGERSLKLLLRLQKRGPQAFPKFLDILCDAGMSEAHAILTGHVPEWRINNNPSNLASGEHIMSSDINGRFKVHVESTEEMQVKMATEWKNGDFIYKMTRRPRGKCIILNNSNFRGLMTERRGSELDVRRLDMLFSKLGFDCIVRSDKTKAEIMDLFRTVASEGNQRGADCFVAILMSHGGEKVIYDVEKEEVELKSIYAMFNNENCEALRGKPKLFFIQACRGDKHDAGIPVEDTTDAGLTPKAGVATVKDTPYNPTWTDIYVAHSTTEGYVSNKNPVTGSWFMTALFEVFSATAYNTHLENMMKEITAKVHHRMSHDGAKQSPQVTLYGWTKKLFFNPGLYVR